MKGKKDEKKPLIIWKINSPKYIYVLLLPFSCMLIHFFQGIMVDKFEDNKDYEILVYNLSFLIYYFLPKLLSLIILIIIKYKNKNELINDDKNKLLRRYHFSIEKEKRKNILLLIYTISLLEVIYKADDFLLHYLAKIGEVGVLIEKRTGFIIFVPLFSLYILNKRLYKHHLIALIFTLLGAMIIFITRLILGVSIKEDIIYHLINIFFSSFFSLSLVLIKYLMIKYIISPYNFLLYDGIFCVINSLFIPFLEYPFVCLIGEIRNKNINNNFKYYLKKNYSGLYRIFIGKQWLFYLSFFISFIASFLYFVFNILTIFNFSPYINVLTDFLTPFLLSISYYIFFTSTRDDLKFIFELIGYIIIFFGALILNEIIVLNFWGLNENTYENISKRGILESKLLGEIGPNYENDDNEEQTEGETTSNDQTNTEQTINII